VLGRRGELVARMGADYGKHERGNDGEAGTAIADGERRLQPSQSSSSQSSSSQSSCSRTSSSTRATDHNRAEHTLRGPGRANSGESADTAVACRRSKQPG
jgi:hypothetical protein